MIVYIYTFPNGKKYIGQTIHSLEQRAGTNGIKYSGQLVYDAIQKYGWDNIQKEIFECETEEEMDALEQKLIAMYHTQDREFGYNLESGGHKNKHHSEETIKKIKIATSGENAYWHGKHLSDEHKKKISDAQKGENAYWHGKQRDHGVQVKCVETGKIYRTIQEAAKDVGLKNGHRISEIVRGSLEYQQSHTSGGYHWQPV